MQIPIYQVDAFANERFKGNPAAICPLDKWLPTELMQRIAAENNLSETAFLVPEGDRYALRWFTPTVEVDLCGHATLASGFVVINELDRSRQGVEFETASGTLRVARTSDANLEMQLPANAPEPIDPMPELDEAMGIPPSESWIADPNYLLVYESEQQVRSLNPDLRALARLGDVIATAPGERHDFVSRFFAPAHGIDEDPVTGSAHCTLAPYWSGRLGRRPLEAFQASERGGELSCDPLDNGTVALTGRCVLYLRGTIEV